MRGSALDYGRELQERVEASGMSHRVVLPGIVNDNERQWLYQHCEAFVFPSLAEGFGLPAIEAMSLGKPTFSLRRPACEIGGDVACYWDDFRPAAMADVYRNGLQQMLKTDYAERARARAALFTWEQTAASYLRVYQEVTGSSVASSRSHRARVA
ncbi:MAG: glycosyltransferase [Planctomycetaceae bacterium]